MVLHSFHRLKPFLLLAALTAASASLPLPVIPSSASPETNENANENSNSNVRRKLSNAKPITDPNTNAAPQEDHVSMTKEAGRLRAQHLAKKKPLLTKTKPDADDSTNHAGSFTSLLFPGTTPEEYATGDRIPVFVELVESRRTQLPVNYFKIPGMCPEMSISKEDLLKEDENVNVDIKRKNLGQRLMGSQGDKLVAYKIITKQDTTCTPLCSSSSLSSKRIKFLRRLIDKQYRVHLTLDSLPILVRSKAHNYALRGFPLGFRDEESNMYYIYNHLRFVIYYHASKNEEKDTVHITGFDVVPVSIQHDATSCSEATAPITNKKDAFLELKTDKAGNPMKDIQYSYEVSWVESDIGWADRWDIYMMETPDNEIHYYAIVNSLMLGLMLTGTVAVIMIRALKTDIQRYNDLQEDIMVEETGWKLVHGDVFRPPVKGRTLLSVCVGTGLQIGTSIFFTLVASALRLLSPMKKGQMLSYIVVLYVLSGSVAGYASARFYKYFAGKAWKRTTMLTATAFPGVLFVIFVALNCFLHISLGKASAAVSFWTILIVFLLWVCVSAPLVFVGAFFGYKADTVKVPTKTTQIARFVPESNSWFVKVPHSALMAGILPFASVAVELSFIMNALWINQIYYIMGFLTLVCFVFTLSVSTVSMVMCYCQLCNEDYKWWWKSFFNGASIGLYIFVYSLYYLVVKLELVGFLSLAVYISYMFMICFTFALYCGGVGVISSFWFCRKIYAAVKVD